MSLAEKHIPYPPLLLLLFRNEIWKLNASALLYYLSIGASIAVPYVLKLAASAFKLLPSHSISQFTLLHYYFTSFLLHFVPSASVLHNFVDLHFTSVRREKPLSTWRHQQTKVPLYVARLELLS